jgi:SEC-C motif
MTLLVSLATSQHALLIADRRITRGGQLDDDEYNKVCIFFCEDARLAFAFTGIATYEMFHASDWLCTTLSDIGATTRSIADVLVKLCSQAGDRLRKVNTPDRALTIVATGFVYWGESPQPITYILSNIDASGRLQPHFELRTASPGVGSDVSLEVAGARSSLPFDTEKTLRKLALQPGNGSSLMRFAAKSLQNSARSGKNRDLIGEQCNGVFIPAGIDTTVNATYFSAFVTFRAFGPNVVMAGGSAVIGMEITAADALAGPKIAKNAPCWCRSTKRFKDCHLRKLGSLYAKHTRFNSPLTPFWRETHDAAKPSGRVFCVECSIE